MFMKRFLNEVRVVSIAPFVDSSSNTYERKFKLVGNLDPVLVNNELVLGTHDSKKYLFVVKISGSNTELFSLSHDDLAYDFIKLETTRTNSLYVALQSSIATSGDISASTVEADLP
jgi:hypothetical protein